jgi:putative nucleotidyltransferase with HDIG domain
MSESSPPTLELDQYIQRARRLPPAPLLLLELLALLNRPDTDSETVVKIINTDRQLAATVLKVCSSAYFAVDGFEPDLHQAVARLGFRAVYQLVAAVTSRHIFRGMPAGDGICPPELWRHSVTSAIASQMVARNLEEGELPLFTTGLIHDLGKIVLAQALGSAYGELVKQAGETQRSLPELEKEQLGVDHAEVGAHLLRKWKFPEQVIMAVRHHHHPLRAESHQRLAAFICLGDLIAHFMGHGHGPQAISLEGRKEALHILDISPESLPYCVSKAFDQLKVFRALMEEGG